MIGEQIQLKTSEIRDIANVTEALSNLPIKDTDVKYRIGRMFDYLESALKSLNKLREKMITEDFKGEMNRKKTQYDFPSDELENKFNEAFDKILDNEETVVLPRFKKDDLLDIETAPAVTLSVFKKLITDFNDEGEKNPNDTFEFSFDKKSKKEKAD